MNSLREISEIVPSKLNAKVPSRAAHGAAPLVVLPLGTEAETVAAVREAGYVPILTDSPEKVKIIVPGADVVGGDLLMAAMHGVTASQWSDGATKFTAELWKRMKEREARNDDLSSGGKAT